MENQVLARKWRPRNFKEMSGQEHVLKALINALDQDRLHHAYLFSGTRGVGKTTIARILAKCLNCETGVSSSPCDQCSACNEIDEGRFVDLIEVDAASRTKVEDTREILENVQYAPVRGRYKVYLIDEVHMLSISSFNALLKTLEEPPPHVKFLLATTDPQKLPATILSRCLQFNLKNLSVDRITSHLENILTQEQIKFEQPAIAQIARAADGSMRDALSLCDQAIGFGNGALLTDDVQSMLGTIDKGIVFRLIQDLVSRDGQNLLKNIQSAAELNPDFAAILKELVSALHAITVYQISPEALHNSQPHPEEVTTLARQIPAEALQLYYQIGINGLKDLPLAPDPRSGFEMTMIRMLAFNLVDSPASLPSGSENTSGAGAPQTTPTQTVSSPQTTDPEPEPKKKPEILTDTVPTNEQNPFTEQPTQKDASTRFIKPGHVKPETWHHIVNSINLEGIIQNIAKHCVLDDANLSGNTLSMNLTLDDTYSSLFNESHAERLATAIGNFLDCKVDAAIIPGTISRETPAAIEKRLAETRHQEALSAFSNNTSVQELVEVFEAEILPHTVKPVDH
jgi:DNA polymerase-3 subunit gamma/tau